MDRYLASSAQEHYYKNAFNLPYFIPYPMNNIPFPIYTVAPYLFPYNNNTIPSLFSFAHQLDMSPINSSHCKAKNLPVVNKKPVKEDEPDEDDDNDQLDQSLTFKQERHLKHSLNSDGSNYQNSIKRKKESSQPCRQVCDNKTITCDNEKRLLQDSESTNSIPVPWKPFDREYFKDGILMLHEEIKDFHAYMSPTTEEQHIRQQVVDRIRDVVLDLWPESKVEVFGSFETGLYLPSSDIDIVIFGNWNSSPLYQLQNVLQEKGISKDIKVLDRATVPIVKMTDSLTDIRVDISYNMSNGIQSVEFIKSCLKKYRNLRYLVIVVKQFLLQRDLNEVWTGGISSYSLILMCISFLQHSRLGDENLGVLLLEFFEYYAFRFNYINTAIRVTDKGSLVPKIWVQRQTDAGPGASILCIEDPLQRGNDIARSSYGVLQVRVAFEHAYVVLCHEVLPFKETKPTSVLAKIIQISDGVIKYRKRIADLYASLPSPPASPSPNESSELDLDTSSSTSEVDKLHQSSQESRSINSDLSDSDGSSSAAYSNSEVSCTSPSYANVASKTVRPPGEGHGQASTSSKWGVTRNKPTTTRASATSSLSDGRLPVTGECDVAGFPVYPKETTARNQCNDKATSNSNRGRGRGRRNGYLEFASSNPENRTKLAS